MKKNKLKLLYAFLIPIILLLFNLLIVKIMYPSANIFSSNQILIADLSSQYSSLFSYLKDVLSGSASVFYSFSKHLGGSMFSTFLYYLSSPLNLLLMFVSKSHLMDAMALLILVKIGFCGLFMYIYLSKHFHKQGYWLLVFSTFYALMSYNLVYYFNIMWLDVVCLTPIVMLGIDKIIENKSLGLYTLSLAIAIISNFYIAYMLCIFCIIYFIYQMILKFSKNTNKKVVLKRVGVFIGGSIVAGLLSSFILVPGLSGLSGMLRMDINSSEFINDNWLLAFFTFVCRLFVGNQTPNNLLSKLTPNVYFGLFPLILVILYFFNKSISKKEKILSGIIYLIFILSFSFNSFNLVWHGFSYPNGYAYRFSFLFSFFSLIIACKSLLLLKEKISYKVVLGILISVAIITILFICFVDVNISIIIGLVISFILMSVYLLILVCVYNYSYKKGLCVLFIISFIVELIVHINTSVYLAAHFGYNRSYNKFNDEICGYIEGLDVFGYRVDGLGGFGTLNSFVCQYSGISGALTTHNGGLYKFLYDTGYTVTYSTIVNQLNNTPVISTLLGMRYYYGSVDISNLPGNYYLLKDHMAFLNDQDYYLYENNLALSLGYLIENNIDNFEKDNSFEYQNEIFKDMTGIEDDVLKPYKKKKLDSNSYIFTIDNNEAIYVSLKYPIPENYKDFALVSIENTVYELTSNDNGVFVVDNTYGGRDIRVRVSLEKEVYQHFEVDDELINLYYLDKGAFEKGINKLAKNQLSVEKMEKNEFSGTISVEDDDSMLFLSIPYEAGWEVLVDGKKVEYEKLYDTFIGIGLGKGNHKIEMTFYPKGLDLGILFSKIGLVIFVAYYTFKNGGIKNEKE